MNRPSSAQMQTAGRLLMHEGAAGRAEERATAAGRVYDKLHAQLDPLLGSAGVEALFVRAARLTHGESSFQDVAIVEGSTMLPHRLRAHDPAAPTESAAALFGTFLALLTSFVGERLTTHALRSAWPMIEATAPKDTKK